MIALLFVAFALVAAAGDLSSSTIVLANENMPESVALAGEYALLRNIPEQNIVLLPLPEDESMSRREYEEVLRDPLLSVLRKRGVIEQKDRPEDEILDHESRWVTKSSSIRYLVSMYGVPVSIADTDFILVEKLTERIRPRIHKDAASVDSELACLLSPPYGIRGPRANPLYQALSVDEVQNSADPYFLIAARLDGPNPDIVRRMMRDAVYAEKAGVQGVALFDGRGIEDGGYSYGDYWIEEAYHRLYREGYECVFDQKPGVWGDVFPLEDAAFYFGWYTKHAVGPFVQPDFVFRPGAVAYHLHSASAASLRTDTRYWAGPLLAKGAAATMGAVHEPYLGYTPHIDILVDRLCRGETFGAAAYMATKGASWQMTFVGDPLYRPFMTSLNKQVSFMGTNDMPALEWAYIRKINQLVRKGQFNLALEFNRAEANRLHSTVLMEKLANLYALNGLEGAAVEVYVQILDETQSPKTLARVGLQCVRLLRQIDRQDVADSVQSELRKKLKRTPYTVWMETKEP